jgi:hypothetical protein
MHAELEAVFAEHDAPKHLAKRDVHEHTSKNGRFVSDVMKQVIEFRTLIHEAETAPHDPALDGKLELMHQTFGAIERNAQIFSQANRDLTRDFTQLARYMQGWKADIVTYEAAKANPEATA